MKSVENKWSSCGMFCHHSMFRHNGNKTCRHHSFSLHVCFAMNKVVKNHADTVPFFLYLDISTCDIVCVFVQMSVCVCVLCVARTGKGRGDGRAVCMSAWMWVCSDDPSDGHCGPKNTEYPVFSNALFFKR